MAKFRFWFHRNTKWNAYEWVGVQNNKKEAQLKNWSWYLSPKGWKGSCTKPRLLIVTDIFIKWAITPISCQKAGWNLLAWNVWRSEIFLSKNLRERAVGLRFIKNWLEVTKLFPFLTNYFKINKKKNNPM